MRVLVTAELSLRTWTVGDLPEVVRLFAEPSFSWFPYRRARDEHEARSFLAAEMERWTLEGIGRWVVEGAVGGPAVGYAGVIRCAAREKQAFQLPWEVGVRLVPSARGRGLGAAAVRAVLDDSFSSGRVEAVGATIESGNLASLRLFSRLGMVEQGVVDHPAFGTPHHVLTIDRGRWEARS